MLWPYSGSIRSQERACKSRDQGKLAATALRVAANTLLDSKSYLGAQYRHFRFRPSTVDPGEGSFWRIAQVTNGCDRVYKLGLD
jgi:hypothetical protein